MNEHMIEDTNLLGLNNNCLVAVEIITTGKNAQTDSMIQICLLPLNAEINPHKKILPFYCDLIPIRPHCIKLDHLPRGIYQDRIFKAMQSGISWDIALDRLVTWFNKFDFQHGKRFSILAHDFSWKRNILVDWLGPTTYSTLFNDHYRDLIPAALFANDRADLRIEQIPFPKTNLAFLCSVLKIERNHHSYDALEEAMVIAKCYKKMLSIFMPS